MKIFGVGLHRTGTKSLSSALEVLGFRVIHYPDDSRTEYELKNGCKYLSVLNDYDALTDLPAAAFYQELDKAYLGSKFILTVRHSNPWIQSVSRHLAEVENIGWPPEKKKYDAFLLQRIYGCTKFDPKIFEDRFQSHATEVTEYFSNRLNDFLKFNICDGQGWEPLCRFLELAVPKCPFPRDQ